MKFHLVVLKPFAQYRRGDMITDAVTIEKILGGPRAGFVVRITPKEG